jgi:hypothetical protein
MQARVIWYLSRQDACRPAGRASRYLLRWMTCRPQEGEHAALVRRWHGKTNYWRELAKQSSPSLVSGQPSFDGAGFS